MRQFSPPHFLALVEIEREWMELLIGTMLTRSQLYNAQSRLMAGDLIAKLLDLHLTCSP